MINVTKTFLPPQTEYQSVLKRAWDTGWMTNRGILVKELETQLKDHLKVEHIICMTNGTLPLQIAIKALGLTGEIITTPFSYVATTASIVWEGCTPVFVDIDEQYLTIDETKIEAAITPQTSAILATHVFGNPCNVEAIATIAKKHNLKVIYDAAHCFGVTYKGQSIFNFGDVSSCSFHATKVFHTGEGGALFCSKDLYDTMYYHHNFGHDGSEAFFGIGINAKMSELQAAMGVAVLPYMKSILASRKELFSFYDNAFKDTVIKLLQFRDQTQLNYSYYPVQFKTEAILLSVIVALNAKNIYPRRYFYPSLDTLPYVKDSQCVISKAVASKILCLPMYVGLETAKLYEITDIIKSCL